MAFYLYVAGKGQGCDFTIGCNETLVDLKAPILSQAIIEAKEWVKDNSTDEREIERALVFGEPLIKLDTGLLRAEKFSAEHLVAQAQQAEERRKQYEALKKEFGG